MTLKVQREFPETDFVYFYNVVDVKPRSLRPRKGHDSQACGTSLPGTIKPYVDFFAFAFKAFRLLLRIMTTERKEPTTVVKKMMRMTGMRMAQTRGGKRECEKWPSSTNGINSVQMV